MKKTISLLLCVAVAFAFVSCKNNSAGEEKSNTVTSQTTVENTTTAAVSKPDETITETTGKAKKNKTKKSKKKTTESTTTPMPKTNAKEAVSISRDDALQRLKDFYGSAYHVEEKEKKGNIQHYEVRDNMGNLYAKLEVNLKTSDAKETVLHSGEVNEFNLLV